MFPQFKNKWQLQSFVTASAFVNFFCKKERRLQSFPTKALICYHPSISKILFTKYEKQSFGRYQAIIYNREPVIICSDFGIGAPAAVVVLEELAALGVSSFISLGLAGSLCPEVKVGEYVICDEAIRDEGTSYHYADCGVNALPSEHLLNALKQSVKTFEVSAHIGKSWTTDAPYRETKEEISFYKEQGVLTVEMEASALFIVAQHLKVSCASIFCVSDLLTFDQWRPMFDHKKIDLVKLSDIALNALIG